MHSHRWRDVHVDLDNSVERIVFEAVRGGDHFNDIEADIALDNVIVTPDTCESQTYLDVNETVIFENKNKIDELPWFCDFDETSDPWCDFINDEEATAQFSLHSNETATLTTGPPIQEASQHSKLSWSLYIEHSLGARKTVTVTLASRVSDKIVGFRDVCLP